MGLVQFWKVKPDPKALVRIMGAYSTFLLDLRYGTAERLAFPAFVQPIPLLSWVDEAVCSGE